MTMSEMEYDLTPVVVKVNFGDGRSISMDPIEAYLDLEEIQKRLAAEQGDTETGVEDSVLAPAIQKWVKDKFGFDVTRQQALRIVMVIFKCYADVKKKWNPWSDLLKSATPTESPQEDWTEMPPSSSGDTETAS